MRTIYHLILLLVIIPVFFTNAWGQANFRAAYRKANPVSANSDLRFKEKVSIHNFFLAEAISSKDKVKELYGLLYLFSDHIQALDFEEASRYLLEAEILAKKIDNVNGVGFVMLMRGTLYSWMIKEEEAIEMYKLASQYCTAAGDSLCMAQSWEQLGATYAQLDSFSKAEMYFERAIPLMEANNFEESLTVALNNYGILLSRQHKADEAISYFEQALAMNQKNESPRDAAQNLNNIADAYFCRGDVDLAIETFKKCIEINKEEQFLENMVTNYKGLYNIYSEQEDYKTANDFLIKHYHLKDSLIGIQTQKRIAELEAEYNNQQQELALQKSQSDLVNTKRSLERTATLLILLLLLAGFGIWYWHAQGRQTQFQMAQNQANLNRITKLLLEKNTMLTKLETQLGENLTDTSTDLEEEHEDFFNQRILTDEDWLSFKSYFEKTFPGYIQRLRSTNANLSEAEERLFLFIKLNLTSKEIANILGISPDSVKKTRQRLRKRLELDQDTSLNQFIQQF